jgi:hypothetical protein
LPLIIEKDENMMENLKVLVERAEARKETAFLITKDLFKRDDVQALVRAGIKLYVGDNQKKIDIEMVGIDVFIADDTNMSFFRTDTGAPYRVWGMVVGLIEQNPNLTSEELIEVFLTELPQRIYNTYNSGATY